MLIMNRISFLNVNFALPAEILFSFFKGFSYPAFSRRPRTASK
jgi:hypothetical protein